MTVQQSISPIIAICNHKGGSGKTTTAWHSDALNCRPNAGHLLPRPASWISGRPGHIDQPPGAPGRPHRQPHRDRSPPSPTPSTAHRPPSTTTPLILDYIPADHRLVLGRRQNAGQQPQPSLPGARLRYIEPLRLRPARLPAHRRHHHDQRPGRLHARRHPRHPHRGELGRPPAHAEP